MKSYRKTILGMVRQAQKNQAFLDHALGRKPRKTSKSYTEGYSEAYAEAQRPVEFNGEIF